MKVANRVALGFGVLILMLLGLVIFQVISIRMLLAVNKLNTGENLDIAMAALQLVHDRDSIEDLMNRFLAARDAALEPQLESAEEIFDAGLRRVKPESFDERDRAEINRLVEFWKAYQAEAKAARQPASENPSLRTEMEQQLERLRAQTLTVYEVAIRAVGTRADAARKAGESIRYFLLFLAGAFIVAGVLISSVIYRSIAVPLTALAAGTRAMAEGKGFYRLDTSRTDEFSQIAKDFNTLGKAHADIRSSE